MMIGLEKGNPEEKRNTVLPIKRQFALSKPLLSFATVSPKYDCT
jgi:hypothetical protein